MLHIIKHISNVYLWLRRNVIHANVNGGGHFQGILVFFFFEVRSVRGKTAIYKLYKKFRQLSLLFQVEGNFEFKPGPKH